MTVLLTAQQTCCIVPLMTHRPTTAQLDLLDQIARKGYYTGQQRRSAEVLKRNGWIEQREVPQDVDVLGCAWFITSAGSDVREQHNR